MRGMAYELSDLQTQLTNVRAAIARAEVSQEYWPSATRRQRLPDIDKLYKREERLLKLIADIENSGDSMASLAEMGRIT